MIKRTPKEWSDIVAVDILDADGWEMGTFETPIDFYEFDSRLNQSTIRYRNAVGSSMGGPLPVSYLQIHGWLSSQD